MIISRDKSDKWDKNNNSDKKHNRNKRDNNDNRDNSVPMWRSMMIHHPGHVSSPDNIFPSLFYCSCNYTTVAASCKSWITSARVIFRNIQKIDLCVR